MESYIHNYTNEIRENINRADDSIMAAKKLAEEKFYDFAASRAYYAVFYASTAILLKKTDI